MRPGRLMILVALFAAVSALFLLFVTVEATSPCDRVLASGNGFPTADLPGFPRRPATCRPSSRRRSIRPGRPIEPATPATRINDTRANQSCHSSRATRLVGTARKYAILRMVRTGRARKALPGRDRAASRRKDHKGVSTEAAGDRADMSSFGSARTCPASSGWRYCSTTVPTS